MSPIRRYQPQDAVALEGLLTDCTTADGHPPLGEHKYLDLVSGGGATTVGLVSEEGPQLRAYAHLSLNDHAGVFGLEVAIHPQHRRLEVAEPLIEAALAEAAAVSPAEVHFWTFHMWLAEIAADLGFQESRELRKLTRSLPLTAAPPFPDGIRPATFRVGVDEEAWLALNNTAFAGHPENGAWDLPTLLDREHQPWFDPPGFTMAWEGEEAAGFCWTKVHSAGVGEIYVIAVAPGWEGRGLGRALVVEGLGYLHQAGCATAMLYVDAANDRAGRLYTSLDFRLDHIDRCFVR